MILLQGKGVSKGVTNGPIYFFQRPNTDIVKTTVDDIEAEKARIAAAQQKSIDQLNALILQYNSNILRSVDLENAINSNSTINETKGNYE